MWKKTLLFIVLIVGLVNASQSNSTNYQTNIFTTGGGDVTNSTNYDTTIVVRGYGNGNSTNYAQSLVIYYIVTLATDTDAPTVTIVLTDFNNTFLTFNWTITDASGFNITKIWLIDNDTTVQIKYVNNPTSPDNETYTFNDLSSGRAYTFLVNVTDAAGNRRIAFLTATTDIITSNMELFLFIGFFAIAITLFYFYNYHKILYLGAFAGIIFIIMGAFLAATGNLTDLNCFSNNIREDTVGNLTQYDYHVVCKEAFVSPTRDLINALGLIMMLIGGGVMVDFAFNIRKGGNNYE